MRRNEGQGLRRRPSRAWATSATVGECAIQQLARTRVCIGGQPIYPSMFRITKLHEAVIVASSTVAWRVPRLGGPTQTPWDPTLLQPKPVKFTHGCAHLPEAANRATSPQPWWHLAWGLHLRNAFFISYDRMLRNNCVFARIAADMPRHSLRSTDTKPEVRCIYATVKGQLPPGYFNSFMLCITSCVRNHADELKINPVRQPTCKTTVVVVDQRILIAGSSRKIFLDSRCFFGACLMVLGTAW